MKQNQGIYKDKNGIFYAGVKVPDDLRRAFGKAWLTRSTGTRNLAEANRLGSPWVTDFKQQIEAARRQTRPLDQAQVTALVREVVASEDAQFKRTLATSSFPELHIAAERVKTSQYAKPNTSIARLQRWREADGTEYIEIGTDVVTVTAVASSGNAPQLSTSMC